MAARRRGTQDDAQWCSAIERPLLSPYDIINRVEWYLSYAVGIFPMGRGRDTSHIDYVRKSSTAAGGSHGGFIMTVSSHTSHTAHCKRHKEFYKENFFTKQVDL
jgi:hypothetical protein